jgi:hypothetical protein
MTKRQALVHPKSAPLSHSTPAKKSTRGPSPRRLSETEVAARLEKMGWEIISGFHLLDQPCVMKHRCGLQLSGLTPKSFCYGKKRLCPVCDKLVPSGWVKTTAELAEYLRLVTQGRVILDTSVAPYDTEKVPSLIEKIPCRCKHGQFHHSIRAILQHQFCCVDAARKLKQTYTLGRMHTELLAPFKVFLADYPTIDAHDVRLVRGDEPLELHCTIHGQLPKKYTPFELQKIVSGSRKSETRSPCFSCQPKQNELTATTVKQFFDGEKTFNAIGVRLALLSTHDEIEADITRLVANNLRPSQKLTIKVKVISPTYGVVADELTINWNDLLKGKQLLPISGGRHSAAHFLFYMLLTHVGLRVKNEVQLADSENPKRRLFMDLYVEEADLYYEMDGGPHYRPMYGKAKQNQEAHFSEQQQRDARKTALLGDKLRRIVTYDEIKKRELSGKQLMDMLLAERDRLLHELGRPVIPFDPKTLSNLQDIQLIFNGWPDKIHTMSKGFYHYQRPAIEVSPDHVDVICRHGHESIFNIYEFSKIFQSASRQAYSENACKGCQQVKKIAKIAEDISRESQGTLALIIDEFQKTGADPILVRIVSGTHQGNIVLLSSHNSAISKKSYATMAVRILAEKPLIQATVFTTLHEAVAARDQVLHRKTVTQ